MQFITLDTVDDPRVEAYVSLTEMQLRNRLEPAKGVFIAESPKVIDRALAADREPLSLLVEEPWLEGMKDTFDFIDGRWGADIPVYVASPEQLKRLDAFDDYTFHGTALVGDPTDPDTLRRGGVENCDAVAAVSEDDSVNLMAAQIAKSIFRREKVICRVSDPHLQMLYHKTYELETVCPTVLTEQAVFRALAK